MERFMSSGGIYGQTNEQWRDYRQIKVAVDRRN